MSLQLGWPDYLVDRDENRCIQCEVCAKQCANEVHKLDPDTGKMVADESKCVDCHRCVAMCPTRALKIRVNDLDFKPNANWTSGAIKEIYKQAATGSVLQSGMGNPKPYPVYWDKMLINASQVTNPSIDPLREPMETGVTLGRKPEKLEFDKDGKLKTKMPPQVNLSVPIMFSAMSFV
jgi:ferredoxin